MFFGWSRRHNPMQKTFVICVYLLLVPLCIMGGKNTREVGINGKDTSIKVTIEGEGKKIYGSGTFDPTQPPICADVEMILDLSCSLSPAIKDLARNVSRDIGYQILSYNQSTMKARVGILTYGQEVNRVKKLDSKLDVLKTMEKFKNIDVRKKQGELCRTHTHLALQNAQKSFTKFHRTGVKQIILLFTDGLTFLRRNRVPMYVTKGELKKSGVILNVISLPHKKGKFDGDEYKLLPHSTDHLFNEQESMPRVLSSNHNVYLSLLRQ
ncbi:unnamed protein product [Owenia fusiformis]|uniref:VWFA domain-containing protein n=1 Tax=Owenia fusiformis TaxID=6347 RepID=A0A8S4Q8D4_OWEFU|nr:unnamed protein product [Owenia fusiformis]